MNFVATGLINCIPIFLIRKWLHPQSFSRVLAILISFIYAIFTSILFQLSGSHGQSAYMWAFLNIYILTTDRLQPIQNKAEPKVFDHQCEKCGKSFTSTNSFDRWCENCKIEHFHGQSENQPNIAAASEPLDLPEDESCISQEPREDASRQICDAVADPDDLSIPDCHVSESPNAASDAALIRFCRYCGNELRSDSKYCDKCGKKVR